MDNMELTPEEKIVTLLFAATSCRKNFRTTCIPGINTKDRPQLRLLTKGASNPYDFSVSRLTLFPLTLI